MINLGTYYLFQPSEIDYQNISMYERSVPVSFKHDNIHFKIKNKLVHPVIDKRHIFEEINMESETEEGEEMKTSQPEYRTQIKSVKAFSNAKILKKYYELYKIRVDQTVDFNNIENEENSQCNYIFKYITRDNVLIQQDDINERIKIVSEMMICKIFDILKLEEKINVMNSLELENESRDNDYMFFINTLKQHLSTKIINEKGIVGIFFSIGKNKLTDMNYFIKNKRNIWEEATPQDKKIINESRFYASLNMNNYNMNDYFGFVGIQNKKKDEYVFKLKENKTNRQNKLTSKGFVCNQHNKAKLLSNVISKFNVDLDGKIRINDANKRQFKPAELCILTELMYRYYQQIKYKGVDWFGTTEMATINNFEELEKKK